MSDKIPTIISLKGKNFDDEMIIYVLTKKFDANDMPYLIENYSAFSDNVKEAVYKKISGQTEKIKNYIDVMASEKELLYRLYEDENIPASEKSNWIDLLVSRDYKDDLQTLLQKMGFSNMTKLVSGDTSRLPLIKNGPEEKAVLSVLKKYKYIEDFYADDASETIKVERKKREF